MQLELTEEKWVNCGLEEWNCKRLPKDNTRSDSDDCRNKNEPQATVADHRPSMEGLVYPHPQNIPGNKPPRQGSILPSVGCLAKTNTPSPRYLAPRTVAWLERADRA